MTVTFHLFLSCLPNAQLWITQYVSNSSAQSRFLCFSKHQKCFTHTSHFITDNIKKTFYYKENSIFFPTLSRIFLSGTCWVLFFKGKYMMTNTMMTSTVCRCCLDFCQGTHSFSFTHSWFCTFSANIYTMIRQITSKYHCESKFNLMELLKGLKILQESVDHTL